ncbi:MAG: hypothetical protein HRF47_10250 [Chloroflexota bacterium]|jgi:hypothetical protein
MSKTNIPTVGDFVRLGTWVGVVLDVFASETSTKHILQIFFAKNIYKQQPPELHILEDISEILSAATADDLEDELRRYEERKQRDLDILRNQTRVTA